jgi:hypothetical protein
MQPAGQLLPLLKLPVRSSPVFCNLRMLQLLLLLLPTFRLLVLLLLLLLRRRPAGSGGR